MGFDPPGLEKRPDDNALAGLASLMPTAEAKRGIIARLLRAPGLLLALPFRAMGWILGLPGRLLRRPSVDD